MPELDSILEAANRAAGEQRIAYPLFKEMLRRPGAQLVNADILQTGGRYRHELTYKGVTFIAKSLMRLRGVI